MRRIRRARRQFVGRAGALALLASPAGVLVGCAGENDSTADTAPATDPEPPPLAGGRDAKFLHGVASGDPLADRVILWTRVTTSDQDEVDVAWLVATDAACADVVASGTVRTGPATDCTVKVDASGLSAGRAYHYRFSVGDRHSPVGRTRTLPGPGAERVRFAVFSCANYSAGFFHVYAEAARRQDFDCVLHLGDYLYERASPGFAVAETRQRVRASVPARDLLSLADYRARHAQQRGDADLRALHAGVPMIAIWDDHEFANDAWREGTGNGPPSRDGAFAARRAAAIQAYHEWMPTRLPDPGRPLRLYRSFEFGELLALHMLDARLIGRDRPHALDEYALDEFEFAEGYDAARMVADAHEPSREMLGAEQTAWLRTAMTGSAARWQVLGQQVLMGRMRVPAPVLRREISMSGYAALTEKAHSASGQLTPRERALLAAPFVAFDLGAWDGYAAARETVFEMARTLDRDLVVLSGDSHNAWANDLRDAQGHPIGVEFATPSVTSTGIERLLPDDDLERLAALLEAFIDPLVWSQTSLHGFLSVTFTPDEVLGEWSFVSTVSGLGYTVSSSPVLRVRAGAAHRRLEKIG